MDRLVDVFGDDFALIRYHTWWTGSDDPFWLANTEDNEARIRYIGEFTFPGGMYTPHFVVDGNQDAEWDPSGFQAIIENELAVTSPIAMNLETALDFGRGELVVTCSGQPDGPLTGNHFLRFALTESDLHIPGNNETFNQVMRDMFPDPQGIALDLSAGQQFSSEQTVPLDAAWVLQNLVVIAFVQNDEQGRILQAAMKKMPSDLPLFLLVSISMTESGQGGDGDGVINPGEDGTLALSIMADSSWGAASDVTLTLVSLSEEVSIVAGDMNLPDLAPGDTAWVDSGELLFTVSRQAGIGNFPLQLVVDASWGEEMPYSQTIPLNLLVSMNQQGFPISATAEVLASPAMFSMPSVGREGIAVAIGDEAGYVHVLDSTGDYLPGFPVQAGSRAASPAIADIDGSGEIEIFVGSWDKNLYCFSMDGSLAWNIDLGGYMLGAPSIGDIDGDGNLEVVIGTLSGDLYVLEADGTIAAGWPVALGSSKRMSSGICLEDLDGDEIPEIIVGTWGKTVEAFCGDGASVPGWPVELPDQVKGGIVSTVIHGAGLVLLAPCLDSRLHILKPSGEEFASITLEEDIYATPAVSDLNGDGSLEILVATMNGYLHVYDASLGEVEGWPVSVGFRIETSPSVADLDGDGIAEIFLGADDGSMRVFGADGTLLMSPLALGARIRSSPALADMDGDGDLEMIVGSGTQIVGLDFKTDGGSVNGLWSQYRATAAKTGAYSDLGVLSSPGTTVPMPDEVVLYRPRPNPATGRASIRLYVPVAQSVRVGLYDLSGHLVKSIIKGSVSEGSHDVILELTGLAQGAYFVRLSTEGSKLEYPLIVLR